MTNLKTLTTDRLRQLINETNTTLVELTSELDRREKVQQEHGVEYLEDHMKNAELSLQTIRDFLSYLTKDIKNSKGTD